MPPVATRLAWEHPAGPPPPRISLPGFTDRKFATFGWIDAGIVGQGINTAGDQLGQFDAGCDAIWRF